MTTLPVISGQACVKVWKKAGFIVVRQHSSHIILRREEPIPARTVAVPDHTELDRGTPRAIIRQSGLSVQEFLNLQ